jgi:hypothetical protein
MSIVSEAISHYWIIEKFGMERVREVFMVRDTALKFLVDLFPRYPEMLARLKRGKII